MEPKSRKDIDVSEFISLDAKTVRSRYPAVLLLYKYRISNDKRNRDALCVGCGKVIVKSKVSRLIYHAKKCSASDEKLVKQLEQNHKVIESKKFGVKIEKKSKPEVKKLQKNYDDLIVECITVNCLPLNTINSKEFKNIWSNIDSSYQLPSKERLNVLLSNRAGTETNKFINKSKDCDNYSLTIELIGSSSLMAVIVSNQNGNSTLIDLVDISSDPNSSTNLAAKALESIKSTKIPEQKFNAILTDDTKHFLLARDILYEDFNNGRMIEYRSFGHVLNQMVGSIIKSQLLKDTFTNLSRLIDTVTRNKNVVSKFKEKGQSKTFDSFPTSKSTISLCINWTLQNKNSLQKIPRTERYDSNILEPIIDDSNFWDNLEKCKCYFEKIATTIQEVSNSKLSDAFQSFLELGRYIFHDNNLDTDFKDLISEAYVTYYHQLDLNLLLTAYILDPNKNMEYLTNKSIKEAKDYITKLLNSMGHKDDVAKVAVNEFKRYTSDVSKIKSVEDIYSWWSTGDTIILKMVATRLIACRASSINTRRVSTTLETNLFNEGFNVSLLSDMLTIRIAQLSARKRDETLENTILDAQNVANDCVQLTEEYDYFYSSSAYVEFKNFIDYNLQTSSDS